MELLDYLKRRWRLFAVLLLVGLGLIGAVGTGIGSGVYEAKSQLLVRPPVTQTNLYAGANLDRYINSEMAQLYTEDALAESVEATDASVADLARSLSWDHPVNSDLVELTVVDPQPGDAVDLVNAVAERYLAASAGQSDEPVRERSQQLARQTRQARADLRQASNRIVAATNAYVRANPDQGVPAATSVAPAAASTQLLAQQQLQRLDQERVELEVASSAQSSSRVLRPAAEAQPLQGWGPSEYAGALAGLFLVLLTLAGVGLALSKRLLGVSRWEQSARDLAVARAVRYRGGKAAERARGAHRIATGLNSVGDPGRETLVVLLPRATSALDRRTHGLREDLAEAGWPSGEAVGLGTAVSRYRAAAEGGASFGQVLLFVDLKECEVEDVLDLENVPTALQERIVPVLV